MNLILIIFVGLSLVIIFLFYYVFLSDKALWKKFSMIESSIEEINREIYRISQQNNNKNNIETSDIEKIVDRRLNEMLENLINSLKNSEIKNKRDIQAIEEKVYKLETNLKFLVAPDMTSSTSINQKEKIKELSEMGYSIEDISKQLRIPIGELQFMLNVKEIEDR